MFSSCPFPDEYSYVCQILSRSVQLFGIFPTFLNLRPPDLLQMPLGARGVNFLAYECKFPGESVYVRQIWSRSFQWFGSFPIMN